MIQLSVPEFKALPKNIFNWNYVIKYNLLINLQCFGVVLFSLRVCVCENELICHSIVATVTDMFTMSF